MKYEYSDVVNDKYIYGLTLLRMHKKADKGVSGIMILHIVSYRYLSIYIMLILIYAFPSLIFCNEFNPNYENHKYLSEIFRFFTPYNYVEKIHLKHRAYLYIIIIIIIIYFCRLLYLNNLSIRALNHSSTEVYNIRPNIVIMILSFFVIIVFPYIIEFLSFIFYIEFFPNDFVIKRDPNINTYFSKAFLVINALLIFFYSKNIFSYLLIVTLANNIEEAPMKIRYPKIKIYAIIFIADTCVFHPLSHLFSGNTLKIFNIAIVIITILTIILCYFLTIKSYQFKNVTNSLIAFIGEFCIISCICELLLYAFSLTPKTTTVLIYFTFIKILITLSFYYFIDNVYNKKQFQLVENNIFISSAENNSINENFLSGFLFLREQLLEKRNLSKILEIFLNHQRKCPHAHCCCKIITISSKDNFNFLNDDTENFIKKINYFIESVLIKYNINTNPQVALLLSENIFLFRKQAQLAYSILQSTFHYNYKKLELFEKVTIYVNLNLYINFNLNEKIKAINLEKYQSNFNSLQLIKSENDLKQYINLLIKRKSLIKLLRSYADKFEELIKSKQNYENSVKIKFSEIDNEIIEINSNYLTDSFFIDFIDFLKKEISGTKEIMECVHELEEYSKLLSYEFLFKMYLFVELFWNEKIPEKMINVFYGFTTDKNIYSTKVNQSIYLILENSYIENCKNENNKYFFLFKYTTGIKITYMAETLSMKLNMRQKDIIGKEMGILFPKDFVIPHNNALNKYFILQKNFVMKDLQMFMFDEEKYLVDCVINGCIQYGINKNIIIISTIMLDENDINCSFIMNKKCELISINKNFENNYHLTLPLIKELNMELKDLFNITKFDIEEKYNIEFKKINKIKQFNMFDTREHIIKNIFKDQNEPHSDFSSLFNILNERSDAEDSNGIETEETPLNVINENRNKINNLVQKICDNYMLKKLRIKDINFVVQKINLVVNIKRIIEKICTFEQDKLENKNLYKVLEKLNIYYDELYSKENNIIYTINVQMRLLYDTQFYICNISNNADSFLINHETSKDVLFKNIPTERNYISKKNTHKLIESSQNNSILTEDMNKTISSEKKSSLIIKIKNNNFESENDAIKEYRKKIKVNKISKFNYGFILLLVIICLLVIIIVVLCSQWKILTKSSIIFTVYYYIFSQEIEYLFVNSMSLTLLYEVTKIVKDESDHNTNKELYKYMSNNFKEYYYLFYHNYLTYKTTYNEDIKIIFDKHLVHSIDVNWKDKVSYTNYDEQMEILIYKCLEIVNSSPEIDSNIQDSNRFILGKIFEDPNAEKIALNSKFISLYYFFYKNNEDVKTNYFEKMQNLLKDDISSFVNNSTVNYTLFECAAIILFIFFFLINYWFLSKSNKYIFQNILSVFLDFTQTKIYSFDNKTINYAMRKKISSYISFLNEFAINKINDVHKSLSEFHLNNINDIALDRTINEESTAKSHEDTLTKKNLDKKGLKNNLLKDRKTTKKINFLPDTKNNINNSINNVSIQNSKFNLLNTTNQNSNLFSTNNGMEILNEDIHALNFNNLTHSGYNLNNISSGGNYLNNKNPNQSLVNSSTTSVSTLNKDNNKNKTKDDNTNNNGESKLTIDEILLKSKINIIKSLKKILIIFFMGGLIFVIYYIVKIIFGFRMLVGMNDMFNDFASLNRGYEDLAYYWQNVKLDLIIPTNNDTSHYSTIEDHFNDLNIGSRSIKKSSYPSIEKMYNLLNNAKDREQELISFFCNETFKKCSEILNSDKNLLKDSFESMINIYSQKIWNLYKDYDKVKDTLTDKENITSIFIDDNFVNLDNNLNYVVYFIQIKFYYAFLDDADVLKEKYDFQVKVFNIIALCYCVLFNLYAIFYVFSYISSIISDVEKSTIRIGAALYLMKRKLMSD